MKRALSGPEAERGFGLVSTIIAMVLLAIAVAALASSGLLVLATQTESASRSAAAAIAASYLEQVKVRQPQQLVTEAAVPVNEAGAVSETGPYFRSLEVAPEEGLPSTKRLTVRVEYPAGQGRVGAVELESLVYEGDQ